MIELKMPALSPTMEKGTLAKWLVSPGDSVKPGDLLAEIETDKATMELEAVDEGRIGELLVAEGTDDIPVGTPIGTLVGADDPVEASPAAAAAPTLDTPRTNGAEAVATDGGEVAQAQPAPNAAPDEEAGPVMGPVEDARATPLAARFASAKSIDLSSRQGDSRIRITDLLPRPVQTPVSVSAPAPTVSITAERVPDEAPRLDNPETRVRLTGMRKTIARRLTQAKQEAPHIYLTVDVRIDALLKLRGELNEALASRDIKLSVNDFMIKGLAMALAAEPACNVRYTPDALVRYERADVAVAVSVPDGLVTPVITGADRRSLSAIAIAMKDLAGRARSGGLDPQEYAGGTASLSNLGMFGIDQFAAVLNPPQAVILAVGAGRSRPWDIDGTIGLATIVTVTGSFDHRAIDGADAARFLSAFRSVIESPLDLTV